MKIIYLQNNNSTCSNYKGPTEVFWFCLNFVIHHHLYDEFLISFDNDNDFNVHLHFFIQFSVYRRDKTIM